MAFRALLLASVMSATAAFAVAQPVPPLSSPYRAGAPTPVLSSEGQDNAVGCKRPASQIDSAGGKAPTPNMGDCKPGETPAPSTKADPGTGVMITSPTGMMTDPGTQPMPKTEVPKPRG